MGKGMEQLELFAGIWERLEEAVLLQLHGKHPFLGIGIWDVQCWEAEHREGGIVQHQGLLPELAGSCAEGKVLLSSSSLWIWLWFSPFSHHPPLPGLPGAPEMCVPCGSSQPMDLWWLQSRDRRHGPGEAGASRGVGTRLLHPKGFWQQDRPLFGNDGDSQARGARKDSWDYPKALGIAKIHQENTV